MPNNIDIQRDLIIRQIFNSYQSVQTFNNIINTIGQQNMAIHDMISNIRPLHRNRRNSYHNPLWNESISELTIYNQQIQIRSLEDRLIQLENYIEDTNQIRQNVHNNLNVETPINNRFRRPISRNNSRHMWNTWRRMVGSNMTNINFPTMQPVVVRPSREQISNATENITFSEINNPLNLQCPISLTQFQANQTVTRIRQCQHIFDSSCINQWFQTNVRCPVCRYDIRENNNSENNNSENNNSENNNSVNNNSVNNNSVNNNSVNNSEMNN